MKRADFNIEHSINHSDMVVSNSSEGSTIAYVIRGQCRVMRGGVVQSVPELSFYLRESKDETIEYITNSVGVFEQVAIHINTKSLFATDMRVDNDIERRFEHALLVALSSVMPMDEVASMCCMSLSTFKRHFRARFQMSPHRWIQSIRMRVAYELVTTCDISIEHIARMCSFSNVSYFTSIFRNTFYFR
jgi:AraC-like DNA-binding protein